MWLERAREIGRLLTENHLSRDRDAHASSATSRIESSEMGNLAESAAKYLNALPAELYPPGLEYTLAVSLALHSGKLVASFNEVDESVASLLAAYWAVTDGRSAHLIFRDEDAVAKFERLAVPVLSTLSIPLGTMGRQGPPTNMRSLAGRAVVLGSIGKLCDEYLRDFLATSPTDFLDIRLDWGAVLGGVETLAMAATSRKSLKRAGDAQVSARIWGADYLMQYADLGAVLDLSDIALGECLERYQRFAIRLDAGGRETKVSSRGVRDEILAFEDKASAIEARHGASLMAIRRGVIAADDLRQDVHSFIDQAIDSCIRLSDSLSGAGESFQSLYRSGGATPVPASALRSRDSLRAFLRADVGAAYDRRMAGLDRARATELERRTLLTVMNMEWRLHLQRLDQVLEFSRSIGGSRRANWDDLEMRSGQSDALFWARVSRNFVGYLFNARN